MANHPVGPTVAEFGRKRGARKIRVFPMQSAVQRKRRCAQRTPEVPPSFVSRRPATSYHSQQRRARTLAQRTWRFSRIVSYSSSLFLHNHQYVPPSTTTALRPPLSYHHACRSPLPQPPARRTVTSCVRSVLPSAATRPCWPPRACKRAPSLPTTRCERISEWLMGVR